jgi:hypothetical protein
MIPPSNLSESDWCITQVGGGRVETGRAFALTIDPAEGRYHNAQIADYDYAPRIPFRWRPPLRLTVRARAALDPASGVGTAGFGFWNHPFSPDSWRIRLPRAIWFFYAAPPNDMRLARGVPGHGWKAAVIDAARPSALMLAPAAPVLIPLLNLPAIYNRVYPIIQRRLAIAEAALDSALLESAHTYIIEWRRDGASFAVDGRSVLQTDRAPTGACGLIAWIDTQFAVVHPGGRLAFGTRPLTARQSLFIDSIQIESDLSS